MTPYLFPPKAFAAPVFLLPLALPFPGRPASTQNLRSCCLEALIQTEPYRTNFTRLEQGLLTAGRVTGTFGNFNVPPL